MRASAHATAAPCSAALEWSVDFGSLPMCLLSRAPPTCEATLKLDLAEPAVRRALALRRSGSGSWQWTQCGSELASVGYVWSGLSRRLTVKFAYAGTPRSQTVEMLSSAPQFGGVRLWFRCPITGERVRALFLSGDGRWASRRALGLAYASQRAGRFERAVNRLLSGNAARERRNAVRRIGRRQRAIG